MTLADPIRTNESSLDAAMERYAEGDAEAFAELHQGLYTRIFAFLVRMSSRRGDVIDDLVQETFLRIHRARASFTPGRRVLPWVYAIARNVYFDHARSAKLRRTEPLAEETCDGPLVPCASTTESALLALEAARTVERTLARLPAMQREAFVLLRYEGMSVQEAAAITGTTPTAIKLRAFRACEALRAELL